jgi:2-polyprenyl-3-methyl-5-hydroxy-6-metoxy-1,4-benzoquinol methylase
MENQASKIICPNCGGYATRWGVKNSYNLFCCNSCRLVFVHPIPNPENVYSQDYFYGAKRGFGYVDYDADKEPMIPTFNRYIDLFAKYGKSKGSIFDIGAATGFFLSLARKRGFEVSGVEMSDHASSIAKSKGVKVFTGDLLKLNLVSDSFDIVTMLDVLEHTTNPFAELLEAKKILKKGGLLVVNSPNGQSLLARFLKSKWHLVVPPEHLFYFSPQNLSLFLKKQGFQVLHSGTIGKRFTFQYIFKMLYKWQKLTFWNYLSYFFSKGFLSRLYIPINLHDNFFMIFRKE